ncbi:MAG: LacI family DNA-binding transcriptional regulator [Phycisphaerales bacterium]
MSSNRPTLLSVAKAAGVSHSTVSLVLNGRGEELRIGSQTRTRILQTAKALNYKPNQLARGLRGKKTKTLGVLWSLGGPHQSEAVARQIALIAMRHGYVIYLVDGLGDPDVIIAALRDFQQRGVDGVVLEVGVLDISPESPITQHLNNFPAVALATFAPTPTSTSFDQVVLDMYPAMHAVVDHLVAAGRRRLALMGCMLSNLHKFAAVRERWCHHGRSPDDLVEIDVSFPMRVHIPLADIDRWSRESLAKAQARGVEFDCLVGSCDEIAAAAQAHLMAQGVRVPQDVAVVGFNDNILASYTSPPLASVAREEDRMVEMLVGPLFERLQTPTDAPGRIQTVPMRFVRRASAG